MIWHVDNAHGGGIFCEIDPATGVIMTDGLDEHGNSYLCHPMHSTEKPSRQCFT